jgi:hypothetical protein
MQGTGDLAPSLPPARAYLARLPAVRFVAFFGDRNRAKGGAQLMGDEQNQGEAFAVSASALGFLEQAQPNPPESNRWQWRRSSRPKAEKKFGILPP